MIIIIPISGHHIPAAAVTKSIINIMVNVFCLEKG